jgi:hypothetical protein
MLSAVAIVPGILFAGAAVHRLGHSTPSRRGPIEILVVVAKFEVRVDRDATERTFLLTKRGSIDWPPQFHALSARLGDGARLRVGITRENGADRCISWAFPV